MRECVCGACAHLRDIIGENGPTGDTECIYGYPGTGCETCESDQCAYDYDCPHWMDADTEPNLVTVRCALCGKELSAQAEDREDGEVYCVTCYLKREGT